MIVSQASGVVSLVMSVTPISYLPFGVCSKTEELEILVVCSDTGRPPGHSFCSYVEWTPWPNEFSLTMLATNCQEQSTPNHHILCTLCKNVFLIVIQFFGMFVSPSSFESNNEVSKWGWGGGEEGLGWGASGGVCHCVDVGMCMPLCVHA